MTVPVYGCSITVAKPDGMISGMGVSLDDPDIAVRWGEIAPGEHLVQICDSTSALLDSLEKYVVHGLEAGQGVVLIATSEHLNTLETRLAHCGIDLELAAKQERYLTFDAARALGKFMIRGWPDDILFEQFIESVLQRIGRNGRRVRAFGEMVALLWQQGQTAATIRLEHLWNRICQKKGLSLFCTYPCSGFSKDIDLSMKEICAVHSRVICS